MAETSDGRRIVEFPSNLDAEGKPSCPHCGCNKSEVSHTYKLAEGRRRRRRVCDHCKLPFYTVQAKEETEAD